MAKFTKLKVGDVIYVPKGFEYYKNDYDTQKPIRIRQHFGNYLVQRARFGWRRSYSDFQEIYARKLNPDGKFNPFGYVILFHHSTDILVVKKMRMVIDYVDCEEVD